MPVTTYEQVVALALNKDRASAALAKAGVIAADVVAEAGAPLAWYEEEYDDPKVALQKYREAQLRRALKRHAGN